MRRITRVAGSIGIALAGFGACVKDRGDQAQPRVVEPAEPAARQPRGSHGDDSGFVEARDRAVAVLVAELAELDARVGPLDDELDARTAADKAAAETGFGRAFNRLEARRADARQAVARAGTADQAHFAQLEAEAHAAVQAAAAACDEAAAELDKAGGAGG